MGRFIEVPFLWAGESSMISNHCSTVNDPAPDAGSGTGPAAMIGGPLRAAGTGRLRGGFVNTPKLHRRLTTLDASFLYFEKRAEPMHIGSCGIYDVDLAAEDVAALLESRLHRLPRYRQRVLFSPFSFAHPTWEDDPDFDIANHVEEVFLPEPGDRDALCSVGGELFGAMLDRQQPLWKLILLRGYEGDRTALISKVHHAMVDGLSGIELMTVMHDLKSRTEAQRAPTESWDPRPIPDPMSLWQDAVRDRLAESTRTFTEDAFQLMRPGESMKRFQRMLRALDASTSSLLRPQPRVPFNGPLSAKRDFAWSQFPFQEVRRTKSSLGGTVNDLVLAILAGGLGRYLREHGIDTDGVQLRAMCPVSMRQRTEGGQLGNQVSTMIAPLFVGILDPLERLEAEREAMERLKSLDQAGGFHAMSELSSRVPPAWQALAGMFTVPNTLFNTVSTNLPGPQIPLYLGGHELLDWYPMGPLTSGIGLFVAILTYNQVLTMGLTVDPKLVPDVWSLAAHVDASYAELRDAASSGNAK